MPASVKKLPDISKIIVNNNPDALGLKNLAPPEVKDGLPSMTRVVSTASTRSIRTQKSEEERGGWTHKLDFLFSCISLSVGLGNVWRFPYLCYKNGGGVFLVTYGIAMIFCGIPIFFQEIAIGQYLGEGGMTLVGQLCPMLLGVGYAIMTLVFLLDIYYCIIIAWTYFYMISSLMQIPTVPWSHCDNDWNTEYCRTFVNGTLIGNKTSTSPVEEFWDHKVLGITSSIEILGGIKWDLFACLIVGWITTYFIIRHGLNQSGKIIWFTAISPYIILLVLLIRGVTLPGAADGLLYYITPQWEALLTSGPWLDGATQIFYAFSSGTGALPALGSYNKFKHNCYKDALITTIINTMTSLIAGAVTFSILGNLAYEQSTSVSKVVKSGPGLVFLTYPDVLKSLPGAPAWSLLFFVMLAILGVDSLFCLVESVLTGMLDMWPGMRPYRKKVTFGMCLLMCILGIPMTTRGGIYIFQLMDYYSASGIPLLWVCFFETIAISWVFGVDRFCSCIEEMVGKRPNIFWRICWKYLGPLVMIAIFLFHVVAFQPVKYGTDYQYPTWGVAIGLCLSFSSMIWIPTYAIYYVLTQPKSIIENLKTGLTPNIIERYRPDM